jgi:hypothetical protein
MHLAAFLPVYLPPEAQRSGHHTAARITVETFVKCKLYITQVLRHLGQLMCLLTLL